MVSRKKTDVVQLSKVRMREDLRRKLVKEAERKDITLNGEIVDRLERSFESGADAIVGALFGGPENGKLIGAIAIALKVGGDWRSSPRGTEVMRNAINYIVAGHLKLPQFSAEAVTGDVQRTAKVLLGEHTPDMEARALADAVLKLDGVEWPVERKD